ncbi:MAG: nuclear transport factor 2 family protein [Xanthomonadales bacterium]|nr:nuclear transport factor 2 family protein [Xanthomonadales bacterium]
MPSQSFTKPMDVLNAWIDAVNQREIDTIVAMYSADHVLLPTFSPHMLRDDASTRQYFEQLASRQGLFVRVHQRTLTEQVLNEHSTVLCGIYTWSFEVDDELLSFASRFSFIVDLSEDQPIRHHHSSQIPRTLN